MPPLQSFNRGVRDLKIATWISENSYGPAYDVLGVRTANLQWTLESDELRGDDVVLDRYSKLVSVALSLADASLDLTALDMILGGTLVSNANYYDLAIGENDEVPYLAVAGRVVGSGGKGDFQFLVPKAKLSGNLQLNAQLDTYLIPSWDMQGVNEGPINGMLRLRHFNVSTALTIPLSTTGGGG
jgi:hypothetical protein